MSILDEELEPEESEFFKFRNHGDRIYARFIGRDNIKTKNQEAAPILYCKIIESRVNDEDVGPTGVHKIFESTHVTRLLNEAKLQLDDYFVLKFCSTDETDRKMKRFALKKVPPPDAEDDGAELPEDWPADLSEPPDDENPF